MLPLLLELESSHVRFEIRGPNGADRDPIVASPSVPAHLEIRPTGSEKILNCRCRGNDGKLADWKKGSSGPYLFEETSYSLTVESKDPNVSPVLRHRDPRLVANVSPLTRHANLLSGQVNFRRQVGLTDLSIELGGDELLRLTFEVFPSKLDYQQDYAALVADVASVSRALALEYLKATYSQGKPEEGSQTTLEWLLLVRSELQKLARAIDFIEIHPHRALVRKDDLRRVERLGRPNARAIRSIVKGLGRGPLLALAGGLKVRSSIMSTLSRESLDTPEHRWLRQNLLAIQAGLGEVSLTLSRELANFRQWGYDDSRVRLELAEVANFETQVSRLLKADCIQSATGPTPPNFASLTLMQLPGYREAYQALITLRLGLTVHGEIVNLSIKDLDRLYESWCFIRTVQIVQKQFPEIQHEGNLFAVGRQGIRVSLERGRRSTICLKSPTRSVRVTYNATFDGMTGAQKPDIVVEVIAVDWPPIFIVLDAKYRIDVSPEYRRTFGSSGPPIEAVNALHRYRDAITLMVAEQGLGRPVVKGIALFPMGEAGSKEFRQHSLFRSLEIMGIGALPFLPGNTALLEEWLLGVLTLSLENLAEPGPPFLALSRKFKHSSSQ